MVLAGQEPFLLGGGDMTEWPCTHIQTTTSLLGTAMKSCSEEPTG